MRDPIRRWLAVQEDLGGSEAILDAVPVARARSVSGDRQSPAAIANTPPPAPEQHAEAEPKPVALAGSETTTALEAVDWRKDAPEIPGPGLPIVTPPAPGIWKSLDDIAAAAAQCRQCPLGASRTNSVPGEGNPHARLMVIGEGPGESEDLSGRPFVGRAGELLDKMLAAIGLPRGDVYIANVVKCRPPKNRVPLPEERDECMPFLRRQIELVHPKVILALGGTAAEALLGVKMSLGNLRMKVHQWNGTPLVVTYHPAALLRNPNWKRPAWDDVRIARQLLDRDA